MRTFHLLNVTFILSMYANLHLNKMFFLFITLIWKKQTNKTQRCLSYKL